MPWSKPSEAVGDGPNHGRKKQTPGRAEWLVRAPAVQDRRREDPIQAQMSLLES